MISPEDIIDRHSKAFREIAKKSNFLRETIVSLSHVGLTHAFWKIPALFSLSLSLFSSTLVELSEPRWNIVHVIF